MGVQDDGNKESPSRISRLAASVDWLTATSMDSRRWPSQTVYSRHLVSSEASLGNPRQAWGANGYIGESAGRAAYGVRTDSLLLRLSSDLANDCWEHVHSLNFKATRVDFAVTVWLTAPDTGVALRGYRSGIGCGTLNGRKPVYSYICDSQGGSTVYVGRRSSERFGRLYNKSAESDDEAYANAWRYELEIKGDPAAAALSAIGGRTDWRTTIAATVFDFFASRGIDPGWDGGAGTVLSDPRPQNPDDYSKFAWLDGQVRPTVRGLVDRHGLRGVLDALGLDYGPFFDSNALAERPIRLAEKLARSRWMRGAGEQAFGSGRVDRSGEHLTGQC
jgi:hypothetical protein